MISLISLVESLMGFPPWGGKGSILIGASMRSRSAHLKGMRVNFSPGHWLGLGLGWKKAGKKKESKGKDQSKMHKPSCWTACPSSILEIFALLWRSKCSVEFLMPLNIKSHLNAAHKDFNCIFFWISRINRQDVTSTDSVMSLLFPTSGKKNQ